MRFRVWKAAPEHGYLTIGYLVIRPPRSRKPHWPRDLRAKTRACGAGHVENEAMIDIVPTGEILGATVAGIDLAKPLAPAEFRDDPESARRARRVALSGAVARRGKLKAFAARFGSLEINVAGAYQEPGHPEVMILSNIVENGRPIGAPTPARTGTPTCRTARRSPSPTCCTR